MSNLPTNWVKTTLGNICDGSQYGWTTRASKQGSVKFLRTTDITKGEIDWSLVPYCQENPIDVEKYLVNKDDILIARSGSVGFSTLIGEVPFPAVFASYLIRFIPSANVEARYIAYFLKSPEYWEQISEAASGIAVSNVNARKLTGISTPLAPRDEQKRIADKLDNLFERVDSCRDRLARVSKILKSFRQSIINLAVSGELTADRRSLDEPYDRGHIEVLPLSSLLSEPLRNGRSVRDGNGPWVLRLTSIRNGKIDFQEKKQGSWTHDEAANFFVQEGDFLVARGNGSLHLVGRGGLIAGLTEEIAFPDTMIRIRPNTELLIPEFLEAIWNSDSIRKQLEQKAKTTSGLWKVSQSDLEGIMLNIPSVEEQSKVILRVKDLFLYADRIETCYRNTLVQVEQLTPSILNKAFCGDLVPQHFQDEPASVLLERIRVEKTAKPKRTPSKGKPKMPKITEEYVKEIINQLPRDVFSFDELREKLSGDYDVMKDILFALLDKSESNINQVFDQEAQMMRFVRRDK